LPRSGALASNSAFKIASGNKSVPIRVEGSRGRSPIHFRYSPKN
jgi:hypothetical protein